MPTSILMPQMGESIAEGTIVRWMKKVGDAVDRDEPLFEISTDKVDAEIPSPAAGVLAEITVPEGETVAVNSVVGTIAQPGEVAGEKTRTTDHASGDASMGATGGRASTGSTEAAGARKAAESTQQQGDGQPAARTPAARSSHTAERPRAGEPAPADEGASQGDTDDLRRRKSSPLVRRIAKEHHLDVSQIPGSGSGGRVTKHDILEYLEGADEGTPSEARGPASHDERVEVKPLSIMRKKIAEHMVLSRRTSAHVHSVFHVSFATVERIRQEKKADYERRGARLTYMVFIAKAVTDALRRHPLINSSLDGSNILYKKDINLGIAVAIEGGLIVPVVKNADEKSMLGLSRAIADVAERARTKQLKPEEVHGGTFTITNPGQFGSQFGMPIINQPQVVDDAIGIRLMAYLTLGYDHRLIDGATADQFMADVKQQIENFDPAEV